MQTLEQLQARRAAYAAAELRILESQEYQVGSGNGSRRNRRAELEQVQAALKDLDLQIERAEAAQAGGRRTVVIIPGR